MVGVDIDKLSDKQNPSFFKLNNGCIKKVSAKKFGHHFEVNQFNDEKEALKGTKDLAEALRANLLDFNDTLIINTGDDNKEAQKLLQYETKAPILRATPDLCKKLSLDAGKYYCYYKPGYANGFGAF